LSLSKRPQVFYELIKTDGKEQCQKAPMGVSTGSTTTS